jgi:hypothetical protein
LLTINFAAPAYHGKQRQMIFSGRQSGNTPTEDKIDKKLFQR